MKKYIPYIVIGSVLLLVAIKAITFYNGSIAYEAQLEATHTDTKNVFSKMSKTITREGFTLSKYSDDILKAINASIGGRYGQDGAKGAMLWLKEHNPTMDTKLYAQLNRVIEAGYDEFANIQTKKLDISRSYEVYLKTFPNVIFAGVFGFPKKDITKLSAIVTDKKTNSTFETGEEDMSNPFN